MTTTPGRLLWIDQSTEFTHIRAFIGNIDFPVLIRLRDPFNNAQNLSGFVSATLLVGQAASGSSIFTASISSEDLTNGLVRWTPRSADLGAGLTLGNFDAFLKVQKSSAGIQEIKTFTGATIELTKEPGTPVPPTQFANAVLAGSNTSLGTLVMGSATVAGPLIVQSGLIDTMLSTLQLNVSGISVLNTVTASNISSTTNVVSSAQIGFLTNLSGGVFNANLSTLQLNVSGLSVLNQVTAQNLSANTLTVGSATIQNLIIQSGITSFFASATIGTLTNQSSFFGQAGVFAATLSTQALTVSGLLNTGQIQAPNNLSGSGIVTKILAGTRIAIDPAGGTGVVTINVSEAAPVEPGVSTSFGALLINSATINRLIVQSGELADQISTIALNVSGLTTLNIATGNSASLTWITNQSRITGQDAIFAGNVSALSLNVSGISTLTTVTASNISALTITISGTATVIGNINTSNTLQILKQTDQIALGGVFGSESTRIKDDTANLTIDHRTGTGATLLFNELGPGGGDNYTAFLLQGGSTNNILLRLLNSGRLKQISGGLDTVQVSTIALNVSGLSFLNTITATGNISSLSINTSSITVMGFPLFRQCGVAASISATGQSALVTLPATETNASYGILVTATASTGNTYFIANTSTTAFLVGGNAAAFGTAATVNWWLYRQS